MLFGTFGCGAILATQNPKELSVAKAFNKSSRFDIVSPAGLEPATYSLEGCCSVQLSYGDKCYLYVEVASTIICGFAPTFIHLIRAKSNLDLPYFGYWRGIPADGGLASTEATPAYFLNLSLRRWPKKSDGFNPYTPSLTLGRSMQKKDGQQ